jgi:hypothetical protein
MPTSNKGKHLRNFTKYFGKDMHVSEAKLACNAVDGQCQGEEDNNQVLLQPTIPPPLGLPSHATYYYSQESSMSFADFDHGSSFLPAKFALKPKTCVPKGRRAFIEELHCRKRFVCGFSSSLLWPSKWDLIC